MNTRPSVEIALPWPPSVNSYWTPMVIGGRRAIMTTTKRAKEYRGEADLAFRQKFGRRLLVPMVGAVRLDVELRAPDRRTRDLDNHLKPVLDALTHAKVWTDDSQVDELTVRRGALLRDGAALVIVTALEDQPAMPEPEADPFA